MFKKTYVNYPQNSENKIISITWFNIIVEYYQVKGKQIAIIF